MSAPKSPEEFSIWFEEQLRNLTTTAGVNVPGRGDDSKDPPMSTSQPMAASATTFPRLDLPAPAVEPNQHPRCTT